MTFDFLDRRIGVLVGPDRIGSCFPIGVEAEIAGIALVGAIGSMFRSIVMFNRNIRTGYMDNRRVLRLLELQRLVALRNAYAIELHGHASIERGDGDWVIGTWGFHDGSSCWAEKTDKTGRLRRAG